MFFIIAIGVFGLCGATWLFPVLAALASAKKARSKVTTEKINSIAVLIPVHNEELVLDKTLESIALAIVTAATRDPALKCKIIVGADACSDGSVAIAEKRGVEVLACADPQGKWRMLQLLLEKADGAEVVLFADAGVLWPKDLIERCLSEMAADTCVVGVAPTYRNPGGGGIEQALWRMEGLIKWLEGVAGGPVSVHGATVMYRYKDLCHVMSELKLLRASWLNDDVVIPLMLRALNPSNIIRYLSNVIVSDQPDSSPKETHELRRRMRIVRGNIEWIRSVMPRVMGISLPVTLLALRRIFRLFWAYWVSMITLYVFLLATHFFTLISLLLFLFGVFSLAGLEARFGRGRIKALAAAFSASLLIPLWLLVGQEEERRARMAWK